MLSEVLDQPPFSSPLNSLPGPVTCASVARKFATGRIQKFHLELLSELGGKAGGAEVLLRRT